MTRIRIPLTYAIATAVFVCLATGPGHAQSGQAENSESVSFDEVLHEAPTDFVNYIGDGIDDVTPGDEEQSSPDENRGHQRSTGVLAQVAVWLRVPEDFRLYDPIDPHVPVEPIKYDRNFPIGGQEAINRGYTLPLPTGVSMIYVPNVQDQTITDLNLAIGKGAVPPVDVELRPFPAVNIDSTSDTDSVQTKGDLWVLPFLNVYATVGKVTGDASITVNIDLADAPEICIPDPRPTLPGAPPRPPICSENDQSGSFLLPIRSQVDRNAATLGLLGAYGVGKWFTSVTASYSDTWGDKASDVSTINASARAGRQFFLGSGHTLTPFFGVNYLDIDTRVQGVATLRDAFPDGDDLNVRYDIKLDNTDKYAGIVGLGIGFTNGMGIQFEWNKSSGSERFVLAAEMRF